MRRYCIVALIFILGASLILMFGCSDRGTNLVSGNSGQVFLDSSGIWPEAQHAITPQLKLQLRNPEGLLLGAAFLPEARTDDARPAPTLILLAPEGGDHFHYFKAGLEQIAKEMIASGEIQPMYIYCVGNNPLFGGYFYSSPHAYDSAAPCGDYDRIIGSELIEHIHQIFPGTIELQSKRGIGGIGQGAYGAFRAAMLNPGAFSSISIADGPLDFDGPTGSSGLQDQFQNVIDEQEAYFYAMNGNAVPFSFHANFDSSKTLPLSRLFIGGSLTFSPNDTLVEFPRTDASRWEIGDRYKLADSTYPGGGDSTTYIPDVLQDINQDEDFDFHLPFDSLGQSHIDGNTANPAHWAWGQWMQNNLDSLHQKVGGQPLQGVNIWVASNPSARWNYFEMTQSWTAFMQAQGYPVEEYDYSGFDGAIESDEYLYDLLRKMLKFHSDNFGD
jgi:S-formylglutathione hydrolase FrmB